MSVATPSESRVVLRHVDWAVFEALARSDNPGVRLTYDRGRLEIMSPSLEHEWYQCLLGRIVEAVTEELNIPIRSAGSTTLRNELKQRGVEPDGCYYLAHEAEVRGRKHMDLSIMPPPDLAIEVAISRSGLDKLGIYADLGVPELWFFDGETLTVYVLHESGKYLLQTSSVSLPALPIAELPGLIRQCEETDETTWIREVRRWVRDWRP